MIPPRRVLAAVDFSEPSRTALGFAARLAVHCAGELHLLHVQDALLAAAARGRGLDLARETREELDSFAASAGIPPGAARRHVVTGSAAAAVCDIATRECADMIVVGAHGMSGAEHAVFGSVAEGVVRRATTPVLVVPATWTPPDQSRRDLLGTGPLVAATDLSEPSVEAARAATSLATTLHTGVELVHVVEDIHVPARWKPHADAAREARLPIVHGEMESLARALRASAPVHIRIETGPLIERLAAIASPTEDRHPMLVLGRRAETSRSGAPGSTAYRLLMRARVPVLVYLPDET
jgi:nucleotide-binding universal stress UspA family protein